MTTVKVSSFALLLLVGVGAAILNMIKDATPWRQSSCMDTTDVKSGSALSQLQPNHHNRNSDDVSISLIVVASGQRSSSTFLSHQVLGNMSCHFSMNEIFNPNNSGDAWETEGKELLLETKMRSPNNPPEALAKFILKVGTRRCRERIQDGQMEGCNNHCWVNYKHFTNHLQPWQHVPLWNSLLEQTKAQNTVFSMAILERDVKERWRSHWFATNTGDWNARGTAEHKAKLAAAKVPSVQASFLADHQNWFGLVRNYAKSMHSLLESMGQETFPVLDFSFADVTGRPAEATQSAIQEKIMKIHG